MLNLLFTTFHFTHKYLEWIEMPSILSTSLQNKGINVDFDSNYFMDSFFILSLEEGKKSGITKT